MLPLSPKVPLLVRIFCPCLKWISSNWTETNKSNVIGHLHEKIAKINFEEWWSFRPLFSFNINIKITNTTNFFFIHLYAIISICSTLRRYTYTTAQLKCALKLHLVCIKKLPIGYKICCFFVVFLLLTKFVPNSTNRRGCFCIIFKKIYAKLAPNFMQIK